MCRTIIIYYFDDIAVVWHHHDVDWCCRQRKAACSMFNVQCSMQISKSSLARLVLVVCLSVEFLRFTTFVVEDFVANFMARN